MEVQKEYLDEFSEAGEKLEKFMIENPEKKLKDIKIEFPKNREEKTSSAACGRSASTESTVPGSVHSTLFISFYVMMRVYNIIT